jgi:hypothetical protein
VSAREWLVAVGPDAVRAAYEPAAESADAAVFVCAHGAGGNMSDRAMLATAKAMLHNGIGVVRFNFLYAERPESGTVRVRQGKSGRPDPMPRLMETTVAVVERVRAELAPRRLVIGGRSMGGRAASMLAADGFAADGLLLLAYPLHPAGKPERLRDAHLPGIRMPVLSFSGTRDPLCARELMERALTTVTARWEQRWIEGADHSFHVLKSSGRTDAGVMAEIGRAAGEWVRRLP